MGKLVKLSGGCSGGDCPAIYAADTDGEVAVQAVKAPRSIRRRMSGFRRGEIAGYLPEDVVLRAADEIRARRAGS